MNIGYVRVSTKEQGDKGHSIEAQSKYIKAYVEMNELGKIEIYKDIGFSASNTKRPKYIELITKIKKKEVKNIIVHKTDRISRSLIDFNYLLKLCIDYEVNFISITDNINFNNAVGRCIGNIIMSFAQMEREQIGERTKAGIVGGFEKGFYPIGGKLPIGIERDKNKKLKYNKDIEIIKEIFFMNDKKYSYEEIKKKIYLKYDLYLSKNAVQTIIYNTLYRGYKIYNNKKYYLLEPLIKESKKVKELENKRKRNLSKHIYLFHDFLFEDFTTSTIKRKMKKTGEIKEYKYYISKKNKNLKINEETIKRAIKKKYETTQNKILLEKYQKKYEELFILGYIDKFELKKYKQKIKDREKDIYLKESIQDLSIDVNGILRVKLSKKQTTKVINLLDFK